MSESFHFLQPLWFFLLFPVGGLLWIHWRRQGGDNQWQGLVSDDLLPLLLDGEAGKKSVLPYFLSGLFSLLVTTALANPVWERLPQPVFETANARVLVLDLSLSMYSPDVAPQRLARSKFKIRDLLAKGYEGQTGLVVFAGDAFVVTPLTRDVDTIVSLLEALDPSIMPVQGSRLDLGLEKALELLQQAGLAQGQVIAITDGYDDSRTIEIAKSIADAGMSVSLIGVGTSEGAPLPNGRGGVIKDRYDQVVLPKLDVAQLERVADSGKGVFSKLTPDTRDLKRIASAEESLIAEREAVEDRFADQWKENGPWLVLFALPLAALAFRRGWLFSFLVIGFIAVPQPSEALELDAFWANKEQRSQRALESEQYEQALDLSSQPSRRGAALYRQGDFEAAASEYQNLNTAVAHYNRGNALLRQAKLDEAIAAYDQALSLESDMEDAKANRELAEQLKKQQESQSEQQQQEQSESSDSSQNQNGENEDQNSDSSQSENSQEENQQESDSSSQDQSEQSDSESQSSSKNEGSTEPEEAENEQQKDESSEEGQADSQENKESPEQESPTEISAEESQADNEENSEEQLAAEQWLRRIPDDPGELLRRKFMLQYQQREQPEGTGSTKPW